MFRKSVLYFFSYVCMYLRFFDIVLGVMQTQRETFKWYLSWKRLGIIFLHVYDKCNLF